MCCLSLFSIYIYIFSPHNIPCVAPGLVRSLFHFQSLLSGLLSIARVIIIIIVVVAAAAAVMAVSESVFRTFLHARLG